MITPSLVEIRRGIEGFVPGILVPPDAHLSITIGLLLLVTIIFTLTSPEGTTQSSHQQTYLRLALAMPALYAFYDFAFGPHIGPNAAVETGLAVVGVYGIMRVLETAVVPLLLPKDMPPRWIRTSTGEAYPPPTTLPGRIAYAVDLATSLRGTSWFADTHWDWAPASLTVLNPERTITRSRYILRRLKSLCLHILVLDLLDTLNKSQRWSHPPVDTKLPSWNPAYPITSRSVPLQLILALSVCVGTVLSITVPQMLISIIAVSLGNSPASWPPMFADPLAARSLQDFWSVRWHAIFRRVFSRLALPFSKSRSVRAVIIFAFSATLHVVLMYRVAHGAHVDLLMLPTLVTSLSGASKNGSAGMKEAVADAVTDIIQHRHKTLDLSILAFFLLQPFGLVIERAFVWPAVKRMGEPWGGVLSRAFAWAFLLYAGRHWSDVWVSRGLWEENVRVVGLSVVRGLVWGRWVV
jgi:hypothetical protein